MRGSIEVDLAALRHNWATLDKAASGRCGAVVKANAYGLGVKEVAPALYLEGCRDFFVANCEEGEALRLILSDALPHSSDARIIVFGGAESFELELFERYRLTPVVTTIRMIEDILHYRRKNTFAFTDLFLHVDTGMNRYGLSLAELEWAVKSKTKVLNVLRPQCWMSHFSSAEDPHGAATITQLRNIERVKQLLADAACVTQESSFANSQSLYSLPEYHGDLARPGIALYGGKVKGFSGLVQKDVVKVLAPLKQIRQVQLGESIGYGADYVATKSMYVGIVAMGYADGIPRSPAADGCVCFYHEGRRLPVIGRVSMDACAVDLTELQLGSVEQAQGFQGGQVSLFETVEQLAEIARVFSTIDYEILTRLSPRFERRVINVV